MIVYLHGFRSAPASIKARALKARMIERGLGERFWCEQLPVSPRAAIALAEAEIARVRRAGLQPTVVGSSLVCGTVVALGLNGLFRIGLRQHATLNVEPATYRVEGYDVFGQFMTANVAAPSTSTVVTTKAFKTVTRIVNINATAGTNGLTAGFNDRLGLPVQSGWRGWSGLRPPPGRRHGQAVAGWLGCHRPQDRGAGGD